MSQVEVDKVIPQSGTTLTIGDSGDTVTIPSGATLAIAGSVTGFTSAGIDDNATSVAITIDSNENVGIGTTSPNNYSGFGNLTIGGTSGGILDFESNGTRTGSLLGLVGETRLASITNIPVTFQVNNAEKMRLNSTGLGIFNSNPSTPIHITSNTPVITFEESDQSNRQFQIGSFGNAYAINDATNSQFRYILDNSGNHVFNEGGADCDFRVESNNNANMLFVDGGNDRVGIGTSSPSSLLSLSGNSEGISFTDTSGGTNAKAWLMQGLDSDFRLRTQLDNYTGGQLALSIERTAGVVNNHQFYTEDSERMRLTSTGLGIGETLPLGKVHAKSADSGASVNSGHNQFVAENSGNSGMTILSGNTSNGAICFGDDGNNCIGYINYAHNGNHLDFGVNGAERMRVDHNSGARLFLGTTNDLSHGSADNNRLIISGHSNNGAGSLGFVDTSGNTDATITANDGSLVITADTQQTSANSSLQFRVDNSEKMRLTSGDRLLINSTTNVSSEYLLIKNNYTRSGMTIKSNTANAHHAIEFHNTNNQVGSINTSGSSVVYNTSSDYRLKENVSYDFDATARLKQLKPARFNFIADADKTVDGFLAHEVSSVVPEAISGEKDAVDNDGNPKYQGIDQSKLVPLLVKTIQELEARITTLEANNP